MKKIIQLIIILLSTFCLLNSNAQDLKYYRYDTDLLSKEFYKGRRAALRDKMPGNSMAVLFANPERNRANDVDYEYHQDPNFYYLTGFTEPNSMLMIFKSPQTLNGITSDEFLFVPDRDPQAEQWTGRRAGREGAKTLTGMNGVFLAAQFDSIQIAYDKFDKLFYIIPKGVIDTKNETDELADLIEGFKKKCSYPPSNGDVAKLKSFMAELREVKQPDELLLIRKVCEISCKGHNEIMRAMEPGMHEYSAQAIGEYIFKSNGAEDVGYGSICGGAENSCILHYESNRRQLKVGDVQLNDMAAEYHGYSADVTRTLPVNGRFSAEQKLIYELVLKAQDAGIAACKPGNDFGAPDKAAKEVVRNGLKELGIIKDESDYRKYFMHGTSHYIGLDVHDAGTYGKLKPGNILTVEPGVYIAEGSPCDPKWWNIGVRIEDDILITETGSENLSASSPRTVEAIEALMKEKSVFTSK
jgi:Xaa-Pro aminopeptidase